MIQLKTIFALGLCLTMPALALADEEDPDLEAAHIRHALMEVMGWNMASLAPMATDKAPYEQARAEVLGGRLHAIGGMIGDAFARNTSGVELKTRALDAIWKNPEDFAAKAAGLVDAAQAFTAAAAESEAAAKKAFVKLGGACKACHEKYRSE